MEVADDRLTGVRLRDGRTVRREVVVVATRMVALADFLDGLGLRAVEHPSGVGEYIPADPTGQTEVPGGWVAGNVTDLTAQVGAAAAVAAYREPFSAGSEARFCASVAGDRRHGF